MKFLNILRKPVIFFPLLLVLIEALLFITNFKPGSYLIGWDNIMPEFDLKLNFSRSIFSIWQEYRGLGVLDGLAHSANLMHTIYIFLLSLFLPDSVLRYAYTHLTHLVGGIAFFFLLRKLTKNDIASFFGSLFYMLNLGVIQMYFAPLEVFTTHFATLPVLALLITNALEKTNLKNLTYLFLGCLLTSPQSFVPTVFIAFGIFLAFMLLIDLIKNRNFKNVLLVGLIVFLANAFWLIPYTFSAAKTGEDIKNSKINQFSSEEIFFRNKTFGDIESVASLKGFMIDAIELDPGTFSNTYFMGIWKELTESIFYLPLYLTFFLIMGVGIIQTIKKGKTEFVPYILTLIAAFIFLANSTPVSEQINNFIRSTFPLLGEAFRFPFTKFITIFAFCFSVLVAFGFSFILEKYAKRRNIIIGVISLLILTVSMPAFLGYFTSSYLRLDLPRDYQDLFAEMQTIDPTNRIVLFPVQTFWNWQYRSWGHRGSGFSWYGLPQPVMERAFDPWSPYDEQFYNEISYATNTQNSKLFENVIEKYDLSYIVLDQSILNTLSAKEINYDSLKKFLKSQSILKEDKEFGSITVYKTALPSEWIYELNSETTKTVYPNYFFEKEDSIYSFSDNYITSTNIPSVINLFPSFYSEKLQENLEFNVQNNKTEYILTPKNDLPYDLSTYTLRIPSLFETEFLVPVGVEFKNNLLILTPQYPRITINGASIQITNDPIILTPQTVTSPATIEFAETKHKIQANDPNQTVYLINPAINSIKLTDGNGTSEVLYLDTQNLDKTSFFAKLPQEKINSVSIVIPKIQSPTQSASNIIVNKKYEIKKNTSLNFANPYSTAGAREGFGYVELEAVDGFSELTFYLRDLYHQASYILFADSTYKSGLPMRFYVDNDTERRAEVESVFSKDLKETTVVIPKSNDYFRGYGFHFIAKSVGKELGSSIIENIETYPFPSGFVKTLQFIDSKTYANPQNSNPKIPTESHRINTSLYTAESSPNNYLVLSQAFDEGWSAYEIVNGQLSIVNSFNTRFPFVFGNKLENHVLVNNWANAWKTENGGKTVIIFTPSYIQYLGQFITSTALLVLLIFILRKHHKHHKHRKID